MKIFAPLILLLGWTLINAQPSLKPIAASRTFTFAVLGDNRGDSFGNQYPIFYEILKAVNRRPPAFVFNTGDLINGYEGEGEEILRRQWEGYRKAVNSLKMPIFNVPGNHDVFDSLSAGLWKKYQGAFYYSFDYGSARFIALDTESSRNRLSEEQFKWLEKQLESAGNRHVFLFLHRPLFPVDGHVGNSLDAYPAERDRLHRLFAGYAKNIKGVFKGHEHLYNFEERDGVPYYITGGGGAELYVPPELGGFYHYLLVRVEPGKVTTSVEKIPFERNPDEKTRYVMTNTLLEDWEHSIFWYTWKQPTNKKTTRQYSTHGRQGLRVWFDSSLSDWSILYAPFGKPLDLSRYEALSWDVFVPKSFGNRIKVVLSINEKYEAPAVILKSGWNRITTRLNTLKPSEEVIGEGAKQLQWNLYRADKKGAAWVVFDNLRGRIKTKSDAAVTKEKSFRKRNPGENYQLLESWEDDLLWGASDETVKSESADGAVFQNKKALKISFDFSKYKRPAIFASLNEPWNLTGVGELTADIYAPPEVGGKLWISFAVANETARYKAPAQRLKTGWNKVTIDLNGGWLPLKSRRAANQIEWHFSTGSEELSGWIAFDDLRTGRRRAVLTNSGQLDQP